MTEPKRWPQLAIEAFEVAEVETAKALRAIDPLIDGVPMTTEEVRLRLAIVQRSIYKIREAHRRNPQH